MHTDPMNSMTLAVLRREHTNIHSVSQKTLLLHFAGRWHYFVMDRTGSDGAAVITHQSWVGALAAREAAGESPIPEIFRQVLIDWCHARSKSQVPPVVHAVWELEPEEIQAGADLTVQMGG